MRLSLIKCLFGVIHWVVIITISLQSRYYYPYLINEETEAQRNKGACSRYFIFPFSSLRHVLGPEGLLIVSLEWGGGSEGYIKLIATWLVGSNLRLKGPRSYGLQ